MGTMQALVWHGPRDMRLERVPRPDPGPGEVLIRVEAVGICGSELSGCLDENSLRKPPLIMGHEFAGTVVQGPLDSGLEAGAKVVVNPLISCGRCHYCTTGQANLCPSRALVGAHRPGAFAEFVSVPVGACHLVADNLSAVHGSLAEPLACAVRGIELGTVTLDDSVLVLGAGAIGLFSLAVARQVGASVRAITDTNPARLATAGAWGATDLLNPADDLQDQIRAITAGSGFDVVIDAVGVGVTRRAALQAVRPGGRLIFLGLHEHEATLPANDIVRAEIRVIGSFAYQPRSFTRALSLLNAGSLDLDGSWLEVRTLPEGPECFDRLVAGESAASKIVLYVQ